LYTYIVRGAEFGTVGHNDTPREEPQTDATKMIVSRDPEIMSGELVFTGTCVEIKRLPRGRPHPGRLPIRNIAEKGEFA
jgi:hypothetical protein